MPRVLERRWAGVFGLLDRQLQASQLRQAHPKPAPGEQRTVRLAATSSLAQSEEADRLAPLRGRAQRAFGQKALNADGDYCTSLQIARALEESPALEAAPK